MERVADNHFTGIIPARYNSARFPGKPLAVIGGKSMIRLVYEKASLALSSVYVATDDKRIADEVASFRGKVIMTSPGHRSGTDRCAEAAVSLSNETGKNPGIIINIQGDEPFIRPEQILLLQKCFEDEDVDIATLIRKVDKDEDLFNPNHPKVVVSLDGFAIYFSRSAIPYYRDLDKDKWPGKHTYFKHVGIYGYRTEILLQITALRQSSLEIAESLEQNRWIENGFRIKTAITSWDSIGIDTPDDLEKARLHFKANS